MLAQYTGRQRADETTRIESGTLGAYIGSSQVEAMVALNTICAIIAG